VQSAWPTAAARLHALGVRKGDRGVLDMQNCRSCVHPRSSPSCVANAVVVPLNSE
jgi:fatty-acyl-CoA synthase